MTTRKIILASEHEKQTEGPDEKGKEQTPFFVSETDSSQPLSHVRDFVIPSTIKSSNTCIKKVILYSSTLLIFLALLNAYQTAIREDNGDLDIRTPQDDLTVSQSQSRSQDWISKESLQATSIQESYTATSLNSYRPTMYIVVSLGCSGSTALYRFLSTLWKELGIEMYRGIDWEWYRQSKNYMVHDKNISLADSLLLIWQHAIEQNRSVLLKFDGHIKKFAELRIALSNMINAKVVYIWRSNLLDRMVCIIRDCFKSDWYRKYGYPVLADTGEETKFCFNRRHLNVSTKAYIKMNPKWESGFMRKSDSMYQKTKALGKTWKLPKIKNEDLFAFESGDFKRSLEAWEIFLNTWKLPYDKKQMRSLMENFIRKEGKHVPKLHNDTIYNLEEILNTPKMAKQLRQYIRIDSTY